MSLIEIKNVSFSYNETKKAVNDVSFDVEQGSYVTVIGHNGSGKSTLAKLIAGLLPVKEGKILTAVIESFKRSLALLDDLNRIVDRAAVMGRQHQITDRLIAVLFRYIPYGKEIVQ